MFRCPCCGQAQEMPLLGEQYLINSNHTRSGFGLDVCFLATKDETSDQWQPATAETIAVIEQHMSMVTSNHTHCPRCNEFSLRSLWYECWNDPLKSDKLETENLCHCGGELWLDRLPKDPQKFGWVCDKCEWVKPNVKVSGSGSALV